MEDGLVDGADVLTGQHPGKDTVPIRRATLFDVWTSVRESVASLVLQEATLGIQTIVITPQ
jgi:hypothetical protein